MANDKDQSASLPGINPNLSEAEQRAPLRKLAGGDRVVGAHEALEAYKASHRELRVPTGDVQKDAQNQAQLNSELKQCKGLDLHNPMNTMEIPFSVKALAAAAADPTLKIMAEEIDTFTAPSKMSQCGALKEVMSEDVKAPAANAAPPTTGAAKTTTHR